MAYCAKCGQTMPDTSIFCPQCGAARGAAAPSPAAATAGTGAGAVSEAELKAFIGENADRYLSRFGKFQVGGVENFSLTWHWPAFLASFWWMLYRKMYLWAVIVFVSGCIPYVNLLAWFGWAMAANYLYFKESRKKIIEVKAANPGRDVTPLLAQAGGVNKWVWPVAIILTIVFFVAIVAAILIPLFLGMSGGKY